MLTDVVATLRMLVEIALFALIGQGVLFVLAGEKREQNMFYALLKILASPAMRFARWITPRFVVERHVPWVALFILVVLWIGLAVAKRIVGVLEGA